MITIQKKEKTEKGWKFVVSVDSEEFAVELGKDYWQKITGGKEEPKESILREFELPLIQKYFPEFEEKIKPAEVNEKQ